MSKKLVITLDKETTRRYLMRAASRTVAEVDEACLPSGATLSIEIAPPFANTVYFGAETEEIGEAKVELV